MPTYELGCLNCDRCYDITMSVSRYNMFESYCKHCKGELTRIFDTAPQFNISGQHTYDGMNKTSTSLGTDDTKQHTKIDFMATDSYEDDDIKLNLLKDK